VCFQNNREEARFQVKTNGKGNVLCARSPIALAPRRRAQIDAAQQRSQLFHRDLKARCAGFSGGDREGASFQTFGPNRESAPVPVQDLEAVSPFVSEQVKMSGRRRPIADDRAPARATHRNCAACRTGSGTDTPARSPAGASSSHCVQYQAERGRVHAVADAQPLPVPQHQFECRGRAAGVCRRGLQQRKSHRVALPQPFSPVVKRRLSDPALAAERPDRLPARLLLGD